MLKTAVAKKYCIPKFIKLVETKIIFVLLYSKLFLNWLISYIIFNLFKLLLFNSLN